MKRKKSKAFVITKVKEKLVYLPPKKFWGKRISGVILLILGSVVITTYFFNFYYLPDLLAKTECPQLNLSEIKPDYPWKIVIDRLDLELPVEEAKIIDDQWSLSDTGLSYLPENSSFEDKGNLIIFGKNGAKLLGRLPEVKKADRIYLLGTKNYLVFEVVETKTVLPEDEAIFSTGPERALILFSTADYLKGKRFVVKAILR